MTASGLPRPSREAYSAAMAQALKDCDFDRYRRLFAARSAAAHSRRMSAGAGRSAEADGERPLPVGRLQIDTNPLFGVH